MTIRKRRKSNKVRGERTHGKGDTKNKRGAGCRGGRGRAGSHKHKYSKYFGLFGKEKKQVRGKKRKRAMNLEMIDALIPRWLEEKKAKKEGKLVVVDGSTLGFTKIVGRGTLSQKVFFKNVQASVRARKKIAAANGKIEGDEDFASADESNSEVKK